MGVRAVDRPQASPQSVRILEIVPSEVELGDRVTIFGDGFPPGNRARVTFRGTLYRPGQLAVRDAEVVVLASVVAPTRLEFAIDDATQALFCGAGDHATHTTFEGDVEASLAPPVAGTSSLVGYLENVTIDVRPSASTSARERQEEGERVLSWLGLKFAAGPSGLVVEGVEAGSRAQRAGIVPGNVVARFDGVRVASAADVVPAPEERAATIDLLLERTAGHGQTRIVALDGLRRPSAVDFAGAMLSVLGTLGVVWFFSAPSRPWVASALQRAVSRFRARIGRVPSARSLVLASFMLTRHTVSACGRVIVVDVLACSLLTLLPFGQYVIAERFEVWSLFVVAIACLAGVAFAVRRSVWKGVRAVAEVAWLHTPAAAAVASAVVLTGSLRLREIGQAQGAWPWDWLAFRSPASILALGLLLGCTRIEPGADAARSPLGTVLEELTSPRHERPSAWLEAGCRAHRIIVAGLASVLFLGGWQLPGVKATSATFYPSLELLGAACFLTKTWSLVLVGAWMRWLLPRCEVGRGTLGTALPVTLLATVAIAATAGWTWWAPPPALQHLVSVSLSIAVVLAGLALAQRLHHGLASAEGDAHLSPFL
jgi:NADH-quinone oxidoreductase subunit H